MNFWNSLVTAGKMLVLICDGAVIVIFMAMAMGATLLLVSILPRREASPCGRLAALVFLFLATRAALQMVYLPVLGPWLWLLVPLTVGLACWRGLKTEGERCRDFDPVLAVALGVWGALWIVVQCAALFAHGPALVVPAIPLGLVGGWITGTSFARLWRELARVPEAQEVS